MDSNKDYVFNVVLLGESGVGKHEIQNSLKRRTRTNKNETRFYSFTEEKFQIDGKSLKLQIWSLSGFRTGEGDSALHKLLCRNASGAMIVFDITKINTFTNIHRWYSMLDRNDVEIMMLGNKFDLAEYREVTKEEGDKLASELGIKFMEISTRQYINVKETFTVLARDMLIRRYESFMRHGVEENFNIRVMVVGNENVGKTTLVRRLLKKPVNLRTYNSTNGIDVHIHSCDVDIETGIWTIRKAHGTGFPVIEQLRRLIGGKPRDESLSMREIEKRNNDFHLRTATVLQNMQTFQDIKSVGTPVPVEMTHNVSNETEETSVANIIVQNKSSSNEDFNKTTDETPVRSVTALRSINKHDLSDIHGAMRKAKAFNSEDKRHKARVDFYDFAGQLVFHASHPTFLSGKAIYILSFDINKIIKTGGGEIGNEGEISTKYAPDYLKITSISDIDSISFWLNNVYMFATSKGHIHPHVILVGTHADKLPTENRDKIIDKCFREIRCSLAATPLKSVLSTKEYVVDNTKKTDPVYAQVQAEIIRLAQLQPYWGEQTPSKWLPLDREIQCVKDNGLKILSMKQIKEINSELEVNVSDDTELLLFLRFLHETGKILFFNEPLLKDYIVLDPVWLIDALKVLITADQFAIRSTNQAEKWKSFCETGAIRHSTIVAIFKENVENLDFFLNHRLVIRLMEKFLFIVSPINITEGSEVSCGATANARFEETEYASANKDIEYIVPSMVHKETNAKLITSVEGLSSTTVFCMVAKSNFLPPAVFHKFLAMCISNWQIVEKNGRKEIFRGICRFNLDNTKHHKLTVFAVGYAIHARITSYVDELGPLLDVCKSVLEFLIHSLRIVLRSMGFSDEFRTCIQCPQFSPLDNGGYLDTDLLDKQMSVTCDDCDASHVMQSVDLIGFWQDIHAVLPGDAEGCVRDGSNEIHGFEGATGMETSLAIDEIALENADLEKCTSDLPITPEHLNHARVCNALMTVCADGLRDILLSQIPPGYPDFYQLLLARKPALRAMKQFRQEQLNVLFPDPHDRYTGTVDQFDITLLYALIRNVSAVTAPVTGWGKPPVENPRDTSLGANVERIRNCRNCVSGHSMDGRLDDQAFENYWKDIYLIMDDIENILGDKGYKDALEKRKDQVLSSKEAQSLKTMFKDLQAEVRIAVETVTEKMKTLKALAEENNHL